MVYSSQSNYPVDRIRPIDPDRQDDRHEDRKRRVLYQGREWEEKEEPLDVHHAMPQSPPASEKLPRSGVSSGIYGDRLLLAKAEWFFKSLTTIEEKVGQLCFLSTESFYDIDGQHDTEKLIQLWQIGGLYFRRGDFRRQAYLIERYQEVSKTPLLMANSFLHGLSFYLDGKELPKEHLSDLYFSDMGKAIMSQNRRLGVQIQFDGEKTAKEVKGVDGENQFLLSETQAKALRKGIREAHGIVGKERKGKQYVPESKGLTHGTSSEGLVNALLAAEGNVQESIHFKTLTFFDTSQASGESLKEILLSAFTHYDLFLFSHNVAEAIPIISQLVKLGKISEDALNRHVLKALAIKAQFFK